MIARTAAVLLVLASILAPARPAAAQTCQSSVGPGIPPPAMQAPKQSGFHAAWHGQSGYMSLCPGDRRTAVVAYFNTGSRGWVSGRMGEVAYLGTWHSQPGQDQPSILGGDGQRGSPNTAWPRYDRVAVQPAAYVGPGQVAWFQFVVEAPALPGTYKIGIRPVIEGAQWLEDYGVFWNVTVLHADGTPPRPTPGDPASLEYIKGEGLTAQDIADVHEGVARVAAYLADSVGGDKRRRATAHLYRGDGSEAVCCLANANSFRIATGHRTWMSPPAPSPDTWSASTERKEIAGHEYAHVWQGELGCLSGATWLVEGMVESLSYGAMLRDGLVTRAQLDAHTRRWVGSAKYYPLRDLEVAFPVDAQPYNVSYLAVDRLLSPGDPLPLRRYCERVGAGQHWRTAFVNTFGISVDVFYERFERFRAEFVAGG